MNDFGVLGSIESSCSMSITSTVVLLGFTTTNDVNGVTNLYLMLIKLELIRQISYERSDLTFAQDVK